MISNFKRIYSKNLSIKLITIFALGLILETIFIIYNYFVPRGGYLWNPLLEFLIMPILSFLIEVYGLCLFMFFIFKKYPRKIWIIPFINFIGISIFIIILIGTAFISFLTSFKFENILLIASIIFYSLKLLSLILAIKLIWKTYLSED